MRYWDDTEDATLKRAAEDKLGAYEAAKLLDRSEAAVRGRARKLGVSFNGARCRDVREHVAGGGYLVRDEVGGVIGVHWACATRSAGAFDGQVCEALVEHGLLLPEKPGRAIYKARKGWV